MLCSGGRGMLNRLCRRSLASQSQHLADKLLGRINHVAIATPDLDKASKFYKNLGAKVSAAMPQPEHGVYTVFVELPNTKIELLHPYGEKSPIAAFLEKNSNGGMHHICIEVSDSLHSYRHKYKNIDHHQVDNIEKAIERVKALGIRTLSDKAKIGAHNKPVVFLHPKDCGGVLLELEQA